MSYHSNNAANQKTKYSKTIICYFYECVKEIRIFFTCP